MHRPRSTRCLPLFLVLTCVVVPAGAMGGERVGAGSPRAAGAPAEPVQTGPRVETPVLSAALDSQGRIGGVAVDPDGNVYVSNFSDAVWRIAADGTVELLTRAMNGASGLVVDRDGAVLQANFFDHTIRRIGRDGRVRPFVDRGLAAPVGLALDGGGDLYVCNCGNDTVSRIGTDGVVTRFAAGELLACPNGLTFDDRGNLYVVNFNNDHVVRFDPNGAAEILATLSPRDSAGQPAGNAHVAFARGQLYVTRFHTNQVVRVSLDGESAWVAGSGAPGFDDGPAREATFTRPNGIAASPDGATLWINTLAGPWRGEEPTTIVLRALRLGAPAPAAVAAAGATEAGAEEAIMERQIRVGSFVFDALVAGPEDGEPVILLHGFPQTAYSYREQLRMLAAAGYRAVAPNQRGYSPGARPAGVGDYAMPFLVGDVFGIADALGLDTFHLVGHDWGGAVAWVAAGSVPDRLLSLTVLSTPHVSAFARALADGNDDQAQRSAYFAVFAAADAEERFLADDAAFLRGILGGLEPRAVARYVDALGTPQALAGPLNWYRASGLAGGARGASPPAGPPAGAFTVRVPTLYVWGTEDVAFGRGAAEATGDFVEAPYRFEALEGVGHWLAEHATERVNELLLEHLRAEHR